MEYSQTPKAPSNHGLRRYSTKSGKTTAPPSPLEFRYIPASMAALRSNPVGCVGVSIFLTLGTLPRKKKASSLSSLFFLKGTAATQRERPVLPLYIIVLYCIDHGGLKSLLYRHCLKVLKSEKVTCRLHEGGFR